MKLIIALSFTFLSLSAFTAEKDIECSKKSDSNQVLIISAENNLLRVNHIKVFNKNLENAPDVLSVKPIGQTLWQDFAILVALPLGKSLLVPYIVFTNSPNTEVILNGLPYVCNKK